MLWFLFLSPDLGFRLHNSTRSFYSKRILFKKIFFALKLKNKLT